MLELGATYRPQVVNTELGLGSVVYGVPNVTQPRSRGHCQKKDYKDEVARRVVVNKATILSSELRWKL
jgi:hypothetical protein